MIRSRFAGHSRPGSTRRDEVPAAAEPVDPKQKLQSMLADIWERSRQMEIDRVAVLEDAQTLASSGRLDEPGRVEAMEAAHKLAGALGTFGLPRGTDLARELETAFRAGIPDHTAAEGLRGVVEELSTLVRSAGSRPPA